jgi:hypothetical protein
MLPKDHERTPHFTRLMGTTEQLRTSAYEVIDAGELAKRWSVPKSWVMEQTRTRAADPLPCVRLGRYVRFEWESPRLVAWWAKRRTQ